MEGGYLKRLIMVKKVFEENEIKSEILAEDHIHSVISIKKLLEEGKTEECLDELNSLEHAMQITLAMRERYEYESVLDLKLI